jgi:glycosyltransferase involved in cell wall biosynthesis
MVAVQVQKKILINGFSARLGGGKTYIRNLLARLPAGDFRLFLYLPSDIDAPTADPRIQKLSTSWPTGNPFLRLIWEKFILPIQLRRYEINVLFCPGGIINTKPPRNCQAVTMFRNMLPFDSRILFSNSTYFEKFVGLLRRRAMLKSMTRANLVIFISSFARKVIESQASIHKAVTIPHGISSQFLVADKALARPDLPFQDPYLLYVSRFEFYKRHLEVIKAYELLPAALRAQYKLLLVGGTDLAAGQQALEYVRQKGLQAQIFFLGEYEYSALPALYKNARLFIFASACENCPNILLEAMGAGVPILCSNYEPMPEFGQSAVTYINPDFPSDISQKIQEVLSDSSKSSSLMEQAKKFNWDRTARETWELLLNL